MRDGRTNLRWRSSLAAGTLLMLVTTLLSVQPGGVTTIRAAAGSTYLCTGYSGCKAAGYSDAGYGSANGKMYWRMYAGHNCTNYAAYRVIKNGGPAARPWSGGGNASQWGLYMKKITDQTPNVGAIAWWAAYANGHGSAGHVAYVEKVVSATEIVISEDAWGGTFHWRRITKDSGRWPSGFIHFTDKLLTNTKAPSVAGQPQVGKALSVDPGTWQPAPNRFVYQWMANGTAIAGATKKTYTPTAAVLRKTLTVSVTAKKGKRTPATVTAEAGGKVVMGAFDNQAAPTLSGEPVLDETLTINPGSWSPSPDSIEYRWRAVGVRIEGASEPTLTLTEDLRDKHIVGVEVARRKGYKNLRAPTVRTPRVLWGAVSIDKPFRVTGGADLGSTLSASGGAYTPADAVPAYQWLRDGVAITGATNPTYRTTQADLGHRISVTVSLTRKNYLGASATLRTARPVRTRPVLHLTPVPKDHRRVVVRVRGRAPGVGPLDALVTVKVAASEQKVRLVDGRARVVFTHIKPGRRAVRVIHTRTDRVYWARVADKVRVR